MSSFKDVKGGADNSIYYRLDDGQNRVRVVSRPVEVWTIFNQAEKTARKYLDEKLLMQDPDFSEARKRWAFWVIDRRDGNMKLAELGWSVVKPIKTLANDPDYGFDAAVMPYDIKITKTGSGLATEYEVLQAPITELTDEEKRRVAELEDVETFLKKQPGVITASAVNAEARKTDEPPF